MADINLAHKNSGLIDTIYRLQRQDLAAGSIEQEPPFPYLNDFTIHHVTAIGRPEKEDGSLNQSIMEKMFTGCHSKGLPILFLLIGIPKKVSLFLGCKGQELSKILFAAFPGISLDETEGFQEINDHISKMNFAGTMTGIPTCAFSEKEDKKIPQIARFIKGMYGETWIYMLVAQPIAHKDSQTAFWQIGQEITRVSQSFLTRGTIQEDDCLAKTYVELCQISFARLKLGLSLGMWAVKNYVLTTSQRSLQRALILLESIYQGKDSLPQPVRTHVCKFKNESSKSSATMLNSKELSTLIEFPLEEMPGFALKIHKQFDVDVRDVKKDGAIAVGEVLDNDRGLGYWLEIDKDDFASHLLVAGATGSGKTNSMMFLLDQLWREHGIPFLVIEPAKHEYRGLLNSDGFDALQIYTLGDERTSPFRLNPFEVQDGSLVQTHIDYLKSVFNAAFSMYSPMPYILEESIIRIYEDKGWDLVANINKNGLNPDSFPTLKNLFLMIEKVVSEKGYEARIRSDLIAALQTRINNLLVGAKGKMLYTQSSTDIRQLLERPTILELESLGDDEEKAFLIGLILTRLYEYRRTKMSSGGCGLKHVTLIEEAHRLLRDVPLDTQASEIANFRGRAVETFCNLLSEIRAYGEGIWLAEQIVSKLSPDARKNTLTKILLRIPSRIEARAMGDAMNIKEEEEEVVASLETGQALVFSKGMDLPVMVRMPNYKHHRLGGEEVTEGILRRHLGKTLPFGTRGEYEQD
ncbi:ATP-binding protein [bacterium]|nr:ATP-binding protein [bacterium]